MVKKPSEHDLRKAEFATRLGRLMSEKGWNQSELARAAEKFLAKGQSFRRDNVHVYLNKMALPRPKQLHALAKALGVPPGDLLPDGDNAENMPYSMRPADGDPSMAWLQVDMKVPMGAALAVLQVLSNVQRK